MREYLIHFDGDTTLLLQIIDLLDAKNEPLERYLESVQANRTHYRWDYLVFEGDCWSINDWSEDEEERDEEQHSYSDYEWVTPEKFVKLFEKRKLIGGI